MPRLLHHPRVRGVAARWGSNRSGFRGLRGVAARWGPDRSGARTGGSSACRQGNGSTHMFYLLMPSLAERQRLIAHLKANQIQAAFHYQPLHLSGMGRQLGGEDGDCPVTERVADTLLRLPFYNRLSEADLQRVVAAVREFRVAS
jgi:hypothetical protein